MLKNQTELSDTEVQKIIDRDLQANSIDVRNSLSSFLAHTAIEEPARMLATHKLVSELKTVVDAAIAASKPDPRDVVTAVDFLSCHYAVEFFKKEGVISIEPAPKEEEGNVKSEPVN